MESALQLLFLDFVYGIKVDLRDGFYHIPLQRSAQRHFGVLYHDRSYVFTHLPTGLKIALSEIRQRSTPLIQRMLSSSYLVGARFINVIKEYDG